jgi:hypothetical protein
LLSFGAVALVCVPLHATKTAHAMQAALTFTTSLAASSILFPYAMSRMACWVISSDVSRDVSRLGSARRLSRRHPTSSKHRDDVELVGRL